MDQIQVMGRKVVKKSLDLRPLEQIHILDKNTDIHGKDQRESFLGI